MSIKPVDLQVMIPKTPEVSRISSEFNEKSVAHQQQQSASVQNKVENDLRQVYSQESTQNTAIREKQEKNRGRKKKKSRKDDKRKNSEREKTNLEVQTSTIDIRL